MNNGNAGPLLTCLVVKGASLNFFVGFGVNNGCAGLLLTCLVVKDET